MCWENRGILSHVRSPISGYLVQGEIWGIANRQIVYLPQKWYTVSGSSALHETVGETGWYLEP